MNLQAINLLPEEDEKKKIVPNNQEPLTFSEEQKQIDTALAEEEPTSFNSDLSNTGTPPENSAPPADAAETNEPDRPVFKTAEEYQKFFGITPEETERPVYDSKERQEALSKRNNLSALGEAFKLIVEADGASNGMYVDKREPNKYMTANEAKIQELKDKDLLEERRRADNKVLDAFRRAGMWSQYTSQQDTFAQQDKNREDSQEHESSIQDDAQAYKTEERKTVSADTQARIDANKDLNDANNQVRKDINDENNQLRRDLHETVSADVKARIEGIQDKQLTDEEYQRAAQILAKYNSLDTETPDWLKPYLIGDAKYTDDFIRLLIGTESKATTTNQNNNYLIPDWIKYRAPGGAWINTEEGEEVNHAWD